MAEVCKDTAAMCKDTAAMSKDTAAMRKDTATHTCNGSAPPLFWYQLSASCSSSRTFMHQNRPLCACVGHDRVAAAGEQQWLGDQRDLKITNAGLTDDHVGSQGVADVEAQAFKI
jgi:hypothetical protein